MGKGNKATKGRKNWKNIDTADIDKKDLKHKDKKRLEKDVETLKDSDLFEIDVQPIKGVKDKLLGRKTKKQANSKVEERLMKRIIKTELNRKDEGAVPKKNEDDGLWADDSKAKSTIPLTRTSASLKYPKIPLPHPGQSYNPSKTDLSNLLVKVVEMNKKPEIFVKLDKPTNVERKEFDSEDEEEEQQITDFKISNNPAVDDYTQRRTKKERTRAIRKRLNIINDERLRQRKQHKKEIDKVKGLKKFVKEKATVSLVQKEKKLKQLRDKKEKEELIKIGVIEE
jgi:hypothetical protein